MKIIQLIPVIHIIMYKFLIMTSINKKKPFLNLTKMKKFLLRIILKNQLIRMT